MKWGTFIDKFKGFWFQNHLVCFCLAIWYSLFGMISLAKKFENKFCFSIVVGMITLFLFRSFFVSLSMTLASSSALGYQWGQHKCGMYSKFIDKPFLTISKMGFAFFIRSYRGMVLDIKIQGVLDYNFFDEFLSQGIFFQQGINLYRSYLFWVGD